MLGNAIYSIRHVRETQVTSKSSEETAAGQMKQPTTLTGLQRLDSLGNEAHRGKSNNPLPCSRNNAFISKSVGSPQDRLGCRLIAIPNIHPAVPEAKWGNAERPSYDVLHRAGAIDYPTGRWWRDGRKRLRYSDSINIT